MDNLIKLSMIMAILILGSIIWEVAKACDDYESENDLTDISLKDYYICKGGWCERRKK